MDMAKYVVKRVLFLLLTFVIIISMCFILIRLLPNETAAMFGKDMQLVLNQRFRQGLIDKDGNPIKGIDRHPILEDNVIVYSNATILGRITIGEGSVIGANIWVTEDMEPNTKKVKK